MIARMPLCMRLGKEPRKCAIGYNAPPERVARALQDLARVAKELYFLDWCREGDSNPHTLLRRILSPLRLPIPPSRQKRQHYSKH